MTDLKVKYRPSKLKKFYGNEETVEAIETAIDKGELPHSILLTGPRGCGKTTLGRIIKNELGCSDIDYQEIDSAVFRGIDTVRDLRDSLLYGPRKGDCRVILIDEVHMLGNSNDTGKNIPQNALLKSLEEPPEYIYFILCTTNPERLISTIPSRCTTFSVAPLDKEESFRFVKKIAKKEKISLPKKIINQIIDLSSGHPRDMLTLLSKVLNLDSLGKMKKVLKAESLEESAEVIDLCRILMKGKKGGDWDDVCTILKGLKDKDPEKIRRAILGYSNSVLLNGNGKGSLILGWFLDKPTYDAGFPLIAQYSFNVFNEIEPPC